MQVKGGRPEVPAAVVGDVLLEGALSLESELDEHVNRMVALLHEQIPELGDNPAVVRETYAQCRASMAAFIGLVRRRKPPGALQLPAETMEYVRSSVQRGVPLSALLRGVRIGQDFVLQDWEDRLAAMGLEPDAFMAAMRASLRYTFGFTDALAEGIANEYQRERERRFRGAQAVRAEAIRALVEGSPIDIDSASRELGYELRRHHIGLVLWAEPAPGETATLPQLERAATEIAHGLGCQRPLLFGAGSTLLWAWAGTPAPADPETVGRTTARGRVSVAVGEPGEGMEGFRRTHRDAVEASRVAMVSERRPGTVTRYRSVDLAALLGADTDSARRFVRNELGPLAEDNDEAARLRVTLKVYLEESESRLATARRLGVHPNTVANRVRSCRELLDRGLGERRVQLQVALALAQLLGPAVVGSGEARRPAPS
jgi:DNA-binding PucR family transcriptional regulator